MDGWMDGMWVGNTFSLCFCHVEPDPETVQHVKPRDVCMYVTDAYQPVT